MNIFQLSCFLAVADTLSFARAAETMNISQPAVTHQIKSLEEELDVKLFRRTTRLVELTGEGQSFVSDAKSMIAIAAQAKLRFRNPETKKIEKLIIGCSSYNQLFLLADSLEMLKRSHPHLHPQLMVVPHDQLFQLLENGSADVVFDIMDHTKDVGRIIYRELEKSPIACVCKKGSLNTNTECVTVADLKDETLIFCNPINLVPEVAKLQWELAEGKDPTQLHFCSSVEASIVLAASGFGIAVFPEFLIPPNEKRLEIFELHDAPLLSYGFFYKPYPGDELLKKFIHISKEQLSKRDTSNPGEAM